jgi:hypothetical protein
MAWCVHLFVCRVCNSTDWNAVGYTCGLNTTNREWQHSTFPFSSFVPVFHACTVKDAAPFNTTNTALLQVLYSKFESNGELSPKNEARPLELPISSINTYLKELVTPHVVHVSSAGVNPPDRPGLDLTKQPPAVRMNKELSYILTFKLKGEDLV